MEKPPAFTLDLYADQSLGKDIVKGMLERSPSKFRYSKCNEHWPWSPPMVAQVSFFPTAGKLTIPYSLELTAILSTIFFHRIFPPIKPTTRDLLDLTLVCPPTPFHCQVIERNRQC